MSRLQQTFSKKNSGILNVYCTAGYPSLASTLEVMKALEEYGADMIELGMPHSDPLADGPVIQQSNAVALANGMTIRRLFEQLTGMRQHITLPVILMGYMNPVLQYGFEKFCTDASAAGIDGLILPDLPDHEFETLYGPLVRKHGLDFIFLVTPETPEERVRKLDRLCSGFLYAVSSSSITGGGNRTASPEGYLRQLKDWKLVNPVLVGFGIKDRAGFQAACRYSNGAIIGSAFIKALENSLDVKATTKSFLSSIIG